MKAGLAVEALTLSLGAFRLNGLDFALSRNEILVILGPNGSGKSVTLETIAGFHRPDKGRVLIGGRDVTALPPEGRNIGFVVQNFGLFPHLNVERNVAIAQRGARALAARDPDLPPYGDTAALLAYFGIKQLARRMPQDLSPGEKQRVALARALAGAPDLFLFDEPFSALDTQTRDQLRDELLSFLRALSIPAVFVTHDHTDARTLADKIVVLRAGTAMQIGSAPEVFQKPANAFVARFVGVENILSGHVRDLPATFAHVEVAGRTLRAGGPALAGAAPRSVQVGIRAEDVILYPDPASGGELAPDGDSNRLEGRVIGLRALGPLTSVELDCGFPLKSYLLARQAREMNLTLGELVAVEIAASAVHVMID